MAMTTWEIIQTDCFGYEYEFEVRPSITERGYDIHDLSAGDMIEMGSTFEECKETIEAERSSTYVWREVVK
jgi:hypothetical protein